jgi:hypothetical protein
LAFWLGEAPSASVSTVSKLLATPAAIRIRTTTITQNHQRFQNGEDARRASGGGGGGGSWSMAEEVCDGFAEPSTLRN